ncbi:alpha/beta fold hydrolase [Streptomyces sp. Ncost-T10-10d]|uniref:alpha/beta fold hydrolase n=1 Tax=Streptomyces sp. Ncost-T10-10d TaxID=1839774 RepID=UPI00081EAA9F|nr:alpha/beta hydrolase [Streptomyces sp. Ncost-T10-10d]SCF94509.1 Pimeloyl-ACP methyl ester carboxylesterase [Streptomyces sp. Ncost-T10-10d]
MPIVEVSPGVSIAYETFGDPSDTPVLLVTGFSAQMIAWHEDFCRALAHRGRYVIRYDNRDCGLSTKFDGHPVDTGRLIDTVSSGDIPSALAMVPYTVQDMADDGLALLTALGIERAHVVGSSMGGMLAQMMAISRPTRVLTLTSMMSSTGEPEYGRSTPEAQAVISSPKPADREGYIAAAERDLVWASKRYGDPAALRELAANSYDRAYYPAGVGRQLGALILSGSRAHALRELRVPTLVIHGLDDTLIDPSGGERTADLVPGAKLLLIPDMGHDRPRELWPEINDAIEAHSSRA